MINLKNDKIAEKLNKKWIFSTKRELHANNFLPLPFNYVLSKIF